LQLLLSLLFYVTRAFHALAWFHVCSQPVRALC
jgi:hypothetical protein